MSALPLPAFSPLGRQAKDHQIHGCLGFQASFDSCPGGAAWHSIGLTPPLDRQALVLQGAAPTALSVLLMAEAHQDSGPAVSTLVISSTMAAMVTVPLWWAFMQFGGVPPVFC